MKPRIMADVQIVGKDEVYGEALIAKETEENRIMMPEMEPWQVDFCNVDEGEVELASGIRRAPISGKNAADFLLYDRRFAAGTKVPHEPADVSFTDFRMMDIDEDGRDEIPRFGTNARRKLSIGGIAGQISI